MAVGSRIALDVSVRIQANAQPDAGLALLPKLLQPQFPEPSVAPNYLFILPCQFLGDLILRLRWMEEALPGVANPDKLFDIGWSGESSSSAQLAEELSALGAKLPKIWPLTNPSIGCCRATRQSIAAVCIVDCWGWLAMAVLSDLAKLILGETRSASSHVQHTKANCRLRHNSGAHIQRASY